MFSVPRRPYSTLHLLCAVDPADSPTMAVRLARYRQAWDGSGATQADVNVSVDPAAPENCAVETVGTAQIAGKSVPLLRVTVPIPAGELADYLAMEGMDFGETPDFFYLEFTRTLHTRVCTNLGIFETKPLGPRSGIHILGATLEKSPVGIVVDSSEVGNVFYADREPALRIRTQNPGAQSVQLSLRAVIRDFWGKVTERGLAPLMAPPGDGETMLPLVGMANGWYEADLIFRDTAGHRVYVQPLRLAILPPDTRQAGDESPFGTWWFKGSHYTEKSPDRALPLVQKMGFRHVTPADYKPALGYTPEVFAKYQVTPSMMRTIRLRGDARNDPAAVEAAMRKNLEEWPGAKYAMVFHETRMDLPEGIDLPPEVLGKPYPELSAEAKERHAELMKHIEMHAGALRKIDPSIKIVLGNGGTNFNVRWFREKLPRTYWDACGMEMAVQLFHPEGQPTGWNLQSLWLARFMADHYGYEDFPITSCYEFDYRATAAGGLSYTDQANWYARDVLHCLAYRLPNINVALLEDCNSSYYSSRWGSTGVLTRAPLMMPKPSFVTLATLTQELDRAEFVTLRETGSLGLYCFEFQRGNERIYALYSSRNERDVTLAFAGNAGARRVDSMGVATTVASGETFVVGETPIYVTAPAALETVQTGVARHPEPAFRGASVVSPMAPNAWQIGQPDAAFLDYCAYKPMATAEMKLGTEAAGGTSVTLVPQPETPALVARCATIEPTAGPLAIPGEPDRVGIWVRGNAGWGRVYFEVVDAEGRRWISNGWEEGPHSWDMSDWRANTAINHDGWRFIDMGLPSQYPSGYYGPDFHNWRCVGDNSKDNKLAWPLRFSRLYVVLREEIVHGTTMVKVPDLSIGLRDLTVGTSTP